MDAYKEQNTHEKCVAINKQFDWVALRQKGNSRSTDAIKSNNKINDNKPTNAFSINLLEGKWYQQLERLTLKLEQEESADYTSIENH